METPFSFEILKFQNSLIDPNYSLKKNKKIEKDMLKKQQEIQRRILEMESLKNRLPPIKVLHEREGNYSLDIKVDNFTLEVSGKVLIENGSLILASGRKYGLIG